MRRLEGRERDEKRERREAALSKGEALGPGGEVCNASVHTLVTQRERDDGNKNAVWKAGGVGMQGADVCKAFRQVYPPKAAHLKVGS